MKPPKKNRKPQPTTGAQIPWVFRYAILRCKDWGVQNGIFLLGVFFAGGVTLERWGYLASSLGLSVLCLLYGYGLNDYHDELRERLKEDPATSNRIHRLVWICLALALALAWVFSPTTLAVVALIGIAVWMHSAPPLVLKRRIFWRLFLNSLGFGLFFLAGASLDNRLTHAELLMGLFVFGLYLPLELIHVLAHMESDRARGVRTFPFVYGEGFTLRLAMGLLAALIAYICLLDWLKLLLPRFAVWTAGCLMLFLVALALAHNRQNTRAGYERLRFHARILCMLFGAGMLGILVHHAQTAGPRASSLSSPQPSPLAPSGLSLTHYPVPDKIDPYAIPDRPLAFPRDEAVHHDLAFEWWYLNAQVTNTDGRAYAFVFAVFKEGRLLAGLLDKTTGAFYSKDYFEQLDNNETRLGITSPSLSWQQAQEPFHYTFALNREDIRIELTMQARKQPFLLGGESRIAMGVGGASYYYALTDMTATGSVVIAGQRLPIAGRAWMDHQWGVWDWFKDFTAWKWYGIHLDNGTEIMLFNIYQDKSLLQAHCGFIDKDGRARHHLASQLIPKSYYTDAKGGRWLRELELVLPELPGTRLMLSSEKDEQFLEKEVLWEGSMRVKGTFEGKPVTGHAYQELNRPD